MFEVNERLEMARLWYDMSGHCPEKGRSHDTRPCCICGKTVFNDGSRPSSNDSGERRDER